jgi:hypothetical protein
MTTAPDPLYDRLAHKHLGIPSVIHPIGADRLAKHQVSCQQVLAALQAAYLVGFKAALAQELGIEHVVHKPTNTRLEWQVHRKGDERHLFDHHFSGHLRMSGRYSEAEVPCTVPIDEVPLKLLSSMREVLSRDRAR